MDLFEKFGKFRQAYLRHRRLILIHSPSRIGLTLFLMEPMLCTLRFPEWINIGAFSLFCLTGLILIMETMVYRKHPFWIGCISLFLLLWITFKAYLSYEFSFPYFM